MEAYKIEQHQIFEEEKCYARIITEGQAQHAHECDEVF
jgi:hypothetical protein